jgi:methylated-DNA-protein-cysteine methyltransferase-like protein
MTNFYEAVYRLVRDIPRGRVMTYGQIAVILGQPRAARAVGYAMRASPGDVPWQRVINRHGGISPGGEPGRIVVQRQMLEDEGVTFRGDDTCDLLVYRWEPSIPEAYAFETNLDFPFR